MCTLAIYFQVFQDYPLVVVANRDEFLARASAPPKMLSVRPWIFGGQDLVAGGTWLGINQCGVVVGVLNRRTNEPNDPARSSRGQLCLQALAQRSAAAATRFAQHEPVARYNPFNLLIADATGAYVLHPGRKDQMVHRLEPGVHLLTNLDLNDPECPRIARSAQRFATVADQFSSNDTSLDVSALFDRLHPLLSDHATPLDPRDHDPRNSLCVHLGEYGTCSSTMLAYSQHSHGFRYRFCPGPPCREVYKEIPVPPASLANHPPSTA